MVRLIADGADVVGLQEVPLWALPRLAGWSGMQTFAAPAKRALLGPLARGAQRLDPKRVRSPLTGQANALLVERRLEVERRGRGLLNAERRGERRVWQWARLLAGEREAFAANLHASLDRESAAAEAGRVATLLRLEAGDAPCAVLGDFNVPGLGLPDFSAPLPGIDQILVRGLGLVAGPEPWPEERRRRGERLLSDHAPVEAVAEWT